MKTMKSMTEDEKWEYLVELDERLLQGGVILSEWATFLIKSADISFVSGAHLASIITGLAGIETQEGQEGQRDAVNLLTFSLHNSKASPLLHYGS